MGAPALHGWSWTNRLKMYQQIYFSVIAALALVMLVTFAFVHFVVAPAGRNTPAFATFSKLVGDSLPPLDAPAAAQAAVLQDWIDRTQADFALYAPNRRLIFGGGSRTLAAPPASQLAGGWVPGAEAIYAAQLPDRRWLVLSFQHGDEAAEHLAIGLTLFLIFLLVGLGIYPVVRKITERLEDLQRNVSALGEGNFAARVNIRGADEVGALAASFNRTAGQLQALVQAQKSLLANASHELRSPLARIQMALGLFGTAGAGLAVNEIRQSVLELDALVGEILLASRLESGKAMPVLQLEPFSLAGFLKEECAPYAAAIDSAELDVVGDRTLLKRLLRNLLDNARRYGGGGPIEVMGRAAHGGMVEIAVADRGPGIPADERDRVFEPFYRMPGTREGDGGVGLGLSIVGSIARLHRGTAYCAARPGGGSVFVVRLPERGDLELKPGT